MPSPPARSSAISACCGCLLAILGNETPLTRDEQRQLRHHPTYGAELLGETPEVREIAPIALHNHAVRSGDWSGNGYPLGISGDRIPLGARIIRVCETYDALTSVRAYRGAFNPAEALALLANGAGKEFAPRIVEVFSTRLRRNLAIHDELLDHWDDLQQQARVWKLVANIATA